MNTKPDNKLLEKFLDNACTPEESKVILAWLSQPEGQQFADKQFESDVLLFDENENLKENQNIRSVYIYQQIQDKIKGGVKSEEKRRIRYISQKWIKTAAAILVPLLITNALIWLLVSKQEKQIAWQEVYVPKGEKLQVLFHDGTKVWLNSDTRLKYPSEFKGKTRDVTLDGEAYFVVNKNRAKPFIVNVKELKIKVTGTSFDVRAYRESKEITAILDEGKISMITSNKGKLVEYNLNPGQKASYLKQTSKVLFSKAENGQNSNWKHNQLVFKDTPLTEVLKILERWYNVKMIIVNREIESYSYTAKFDNESLQNVLAGLEKITPIRCVVKSGNVEIFKKNQNHSK